MHAARETPLDQGNAPGTNRRRRPRKAPGNFYTTESYWRAIKYACLRAFPPTAPLAKQVDETAAQWKARLSDEQRAQLREWLKAHRFHPHQLRHTHATLVRHGRGLEAVQLQLDHHTLSAAQVYAEKNARLKPEVAAWAATMINAMIA
jgi:integrase